MGIDGEKIILFFVCSVPHIRFVQSCMLSFLPAAHDVYEAYDRDLYLVYLSALVYARVCVCVFVMKHTLYN